MEYDWRELQRTAHQEFGRRLDAVTDWAAPTPDTEWDVRKLVVHVVEEQQWVPLLLAGRTVGEARSRLDRLGDDLAEEWARYSRAATDVIIHSWDLARAVGAGERLDDELVAAAWSQLEPQKDMLQASGLFAPPVPLPDDASLQSRLLALTGRDDRVVR